MKHQIINTQIREVLGNEVRKLRSKGEIPAVVYGKNFTPKSIQVSARQFFQVYKVTGKTGVVDLKFDKEVIPAIIQDFDLHPVKQTFRHIDFLAVDLKQKATTDVPVKLLNQEQVEKDLGGLINLIHETLSVEALPDLIPHEINIDVSAFLKNLGDFVLVKDIKIDGKFAILNEGDETILNISGIDIVEEPETTEIQSIDTAIKSDGTESESK